MTQSLLHRVKSLAQTLLPVSNDALLVILGLGCYLATCLILRRPLDWHWALLPGLTAAFLLESWEIWDHYGADGLAQLAARDVLAMLLRHSGDILLMNAAPFAVYLTARLLAR